MVKLVVLEGEILEMQILQLVVRELHHKVMQVAAHQAVVALMVEAGEELPQWAQQEAALVEQAVMV
jgi:hypothetical protein